MTQRTTCPRVLHDSEYCMSQSITCIKSQVDTALFFYSDSLSLKLLLFSLSGNDACNNSSSLHPALQPDDEVVDDDSSEGLPKHSPSMLDEQEASGGWKGFFLASSSKCFDDELCFAVSHKFGTPSNLRASPSTPHL